MHGQPFKFPAIAHVRRYNCYAHNTIASYLAIATLILASCIMLVTIINRAILIKQVKRYMK